MSLDLFVGVGSIDGPRPDGTDAITLGLASNAIKCAQQALLACTT